MILLPFKAGDHVSAAGVTGKVTEVGLFTTTLLTQDNVATFVDNSTALGSILRNYNTSGARRIELAGLAPRGADLPALLVTLKEVLAEVPGVLEKPAPEVELLSFDAQTLRLVIRPYADPDQYWLVLFAATTALLPHLSSVSPRGAENELEAEEFEPGEAEEEDKEK